MPLGVRLRPAQRLRVDHVDLQLLQTLGKGGARQVDHLAHPIAAGESSCAELQIQSEDAVSPVVGEFAGRVEQGGDSMLVASLARS